MKNQFTYNVFFKEDGCTLEETMQIVLLNYIKEIINGNNNCKTGLLEV